PFRHHRHRSIDTTKIARLHGEASSKTLASVNRADIEIRSRSGAGLPRLEIRAVDREERDDVDQEQDESSRDDGGGQRGDQEDDRAESNDVREGDGPAPQLPAQDPESGPDGDDRRGYT